MPHTCLHNVTPFHTLTPFHTPPTPNPTDTSLSFVNGISTPRGGSHIKLIQRQLCDHFTHLLHKSSAQFQKQSSSTQSQAVVVTPGQLQKHVAIFLNCLIQNPTFDSQTKDALITPTGKKGRCPDCVCACREEQGGWNDRLNMGVVMDCDCDMNGMTV